MRTGPDPERYPVPAASRRVEEVVERSRFITTVGRAEDSSTARAFRERVQADFPDATHHCWAFVAGPPGRTASVGFSDDGEPHGTAGRPILNVLLHSGIGEIVAVVTRYYGGRKLGTGGLARAYSSGVARALEGLPRVERVERVPACISVAYRWVDPLLRLLEELGIDVVGESYGPDVTYDLAVPVDRRAALRDGLADLSRGTASLTFPDRSPDADGRDAADPSRPDRSGPP